MRRQVSSGTAVVLDPLADPATLEQPLFAINWFNTRIGWLYGLYNLLAAPAVFRIGAEVFLKARLREALHGDASDARDLLLIVNYPSGARFLDLLANVYFQLISVLRVAAVKDFSFVLFKRLNDEGPRDTPRQEIDKTKAYAIHHFQSSTPLDAELSEVATMTGENVRLFFAGEKTATISIESREHRTLPFVTHKLLLFEAGSYAVLERFLKSDRYKDFVAGLDSSFIGTLDRTM